MVPFTTVLHGLCSPGMADDLRRALQAVEKLQEENATSDGLTTTATEGAAAAEATKRNAATVRAQFELARATVVLAEDLSCRIRRGEFHLQGRLMQPESPASPVVITLALGTRVAIDPVANTVDIAGRVYADVQGILGPPPSATADEGTPRRLPLWDALVTWCDPKILCEIRRNEGFFSRAELRSFDYPTLGTAGNGGGKLSRSAFSSASEQLGRLWADLARDMIRRIERGEVYLQGVQMQPERRTEREPIPSTWAADFNFDLKAGTLTIAGSRYVALTCSLDQAEASCATQPRAEPSLITPSQRIIRPEDVADLDDETILVLLEEHARRVVEGPDAKLIAPGKVSLMPLIKRKMEHRAATGKLLPDLTGEAKWLADWIAEKAPSHHCPTAGSIENSLRSRYRGL
ncbi:hypothetical protein ACFQS7_29155 [Dankookia sp. GCM10030260]|uniref:hypothetical protein n=1 Tax=Dankookia sp. GCM10030260 TaxID=3273390 RepID=UPI00361DDFBF